METFYIETSKQFSEEDLLHCWQMIIPWLVERATRYRIVCNPGKKGALEIINVLTEHADSREEREIRVESRLVDSILKLIFKNYRMPDTVFQGVSDSALVDILLLGPLPDASVAADIAPCPEVTLFRNDEILFSSYDYGRFQTLYITKDEAGELRNLLKKSGLLESILVEHRDAGEYNKSRWFFTGKTD